MEFTRRDKAECSRITVAGFRAVAGILCQRNILVCVTSSRRSQLSQLGNKHDCRVTDVGNVDGMATVLNGAWHIRLGTFISREQLSIGLLQFCNFSHGVSRRA